MDATERSEKVEKQLQFWLSVPNLKRDWYLRSKMNKEGWIRADLFLKFNTVKGLGLNIDEVLEAGTKLNDVEVDFAEKRIRPLFDPSDLIRNYADERRRTMFVTGLERGDGHVEVAELLRDYPGVRLLISEHTQARRQGQRQMPPAPLTRTTTTKTMAK